MQLDKENMKKIRWLIAFAILLYLGEPAHSHQHCQSSAWLSLSVHHWLWNRFYPQYSNEIHRTSSVRKSLETREKNSTKTGKAGQPGAFYLLCDLYNRDRYAGSSTGTGGNIRKHSEKDRRKYSGFPEMDRQCIRKQSGSCEMGAVS